MAPAPRLEASSSSSDDIVSPELVSVISPWSVLLSSTILCREGFDNQQFVEMTVNKNRYILKKCCHAFINLFYLYECDLWLNDSLQYLKSLSGVLRGFQSISYKQSVSLVKSTCKQTNEQLPTTTLFRI